MKNRIKHKILITILAYLSINFFFSFSQDRIKIDSLEKILKATKEDTTRIKALIKLSQEYWYTQPDTAFLIAKEAYTLAKQDSYKKQMADAANSMAASFYFKGDYSNALKHWLNSLKISEERNDKTAIARSLGNIGIVYRMQGDYPNALKHYFGTLKIAKELGDKNMIAPRLGDIGILYHNMGDYPKALEYYFKAQKMYEELELKRDISINLGHIGGVYYHQGDYPKTLEYYFKAMKMSEELGNKNDIAGHLGNIGSVYKEQGDYPKALEIYFKALKMVEELGMKSDIAINLGNIGSLYTETGRFKEAEEYLDSALMMSNSIGFFGQTESCHKELSYLYDTLAQINSKSKIQNSKYYKLAYEHYKQYSTAKDSLFNEEKSKEIGKLEARHEFETAEMERKRKEEEQVRMEAEQKARRDNLQYSGILIFLVVLMIAISFSGKLALPIRLAEGIVFFTFLLLFEFCLVYLDPYIDNWTGGEPAYKLAINAGLAGMIFPLHHFFESMLKQRIFKAKRRQITKRQTN